MIAVRHENDVARADFLEHFDRSLGGSVHAVVAETFGPGGASVDLEVVDLFQGRFDVAVLVVFVAGIRRPVPAGGDDLTRDDGVGLEGVCGGEVVNLSAAVPGTAELDRNS